MPDNPLTHRQLAARLGRETVAAVVSENAQSLTMNGRP